MDCEAKNNDGACYGFYDVFKMAKINDRCSRLGIDPLYPKVPQPSTTTELFGFKYARMLTLGGYCKVEG